MFSTLLAAAVSSVLSQAGPIAGSNLSTLQLDGLHWTGNFTVRVHARGTDRTDLILVGTMRSMKHQDKPAFDAMLTFTVPVSEWILSEWTVAERDGELLATTRLGRTAYRVDRSEAGVEVWSDRAAPGGPSFTIHQAQIQTQQLSASHAAALFGAIFDPQGAAPDFAECLSAALDTCLPHGTGSLTYSFDQIDRAVSCRFDCFASAQQP